uniref:FHA domain-containing protein n=1 Tax=Theileria annulata TaxID=5874 RepID=A0A3B0MR40_THEAN
MVSLRNSAIVNRVRNVYRDNTKDSALESLRLQSVSISNIRNLSAGLSSSDSSELDLESSHSSLHFNSRKRLNERKVIRSRSQSLESIALQRNNTFSQNDKRLHYDNSLQYENGIQCDDQLEHNGLQYEKEDSGESENMDEYEDRVEDEYESIIGSDDEYRTANGTQEDISPLDLLMNFTNDTNDNVDRGKSKISYKTTQSYNSSDNSKLLNSDDSSITTPLSNLLLFESQVNDNINKSRTKPGNKIKPTLNHSNKPNNNTYTDTGVNGVDNMLDVGYIENKKLRLNFEPKLSVVDDYSYVPSRVVINKSTFFIGSDVFCDLVLPKKHFKFIAPKHVKFVLEHPITDQSTNKPNSNNLDFRIKLSRCSTSCALYLNNNFIRGSSYIESGDVICLGPRNNFLAFKFYFQEENSNSQNHSDDRIVISDDISLMDVKIFVFQLPKTVNTSRNGANTHRSSYSDDDSDEEWNENNYKSPSRRYFSQLNHNTSGVNSVDSAVEKSGYYRLKSPVRKYNFIQQEIKEAQTEEQFDNLDSKETEPFLQFYSSENKNNEELNLNEQLDSNDKVDINDEIDLNVDVNSNSTPRNNQYKLIGIIDCWNNMAISEILPDLNEKMNKNVDGNKKGKYGLIVNNKELKGKELELKVYQLELLNREIPEIKDALDNYNNLKDKENSLENIIKNNLCKILFVNLN